MDVHSIFSDYCCVNHDLKLIELTVIFRFIISERGMFEKTSTLTLTNVRTEDSGQYMCVALNPAGKVEANFTLQV